NLVFTLLVGIPSIKQSAEVCTLEVEAIVIDNKSDLKSDTSGWYTFNKAECGGMYVRGRSNCY
ncbi:hypothetical protein, partial [Roseburia inulinivorans]|uniref:hypothetical protein n=1 Tax=Roseburia inulinivorans TaxID=360807 RepID=UPI001C25866A